MTVIVWFRRDLRLDDNPALTAAIATGEPVIPLYIIESHENDPWSLGGAARWWLDQSLRKLDAQLQALGSRLFVRRGNPKAVFQTILDKCSVSQVHWNRRYEPVGINCDTQIKAWLKDQDITAVSHSGHLLIEPWIIRRPGQPGFASFADYWHALNRCIEDGLARSLHPAPGQMPTPPNTLKPTNFQELGLDCDSKVAKGYAAIWNPGAEGAEQRLQTFVESTLPGYRDERHRADKMSTGQLSPHLAFGEVSVWRVWTAITEDHRQQYPLSVISFLRQLGWRDFAYYLIYNHPHTPIEPLDDEFRLFPYREGVDADTDFNLWRTGMTGYPLVDATMRCLYATGWISNRLRMVTASFLTKHLLLPWQRGAVWFWDTLVDADLANNTMGWQWSAGCGTDHLFRIFHPVRQSIEYDPEAVFIRRWVPELAHLPTPLVHEPWRTGEGMFGEKPVEQYPQPMIEHAVGRDRAFEALREIDPHRQRVAVRPPRQPQMGGHGHHGGYREYRSR